MLGGELSLSHDVSASVTGYVTLSRGYKAGGFNLGVVPDDRRDYDAESMWNLEAGIKSRWLENRLQFDGSVFFAQRDDQQVRTSFQIDPGDPTSFVFYTDNAATGDTTGLEAELRWQPGPAWDLHASIGLLDATFDRFRTPQVDLSGREQAHAPDYSVAVGARYSRPSGLFARLDLTARDDFYFDVSHDERSDAYWLANARLGFETDKWLLQLWARNLFDKDYAVRGFYFGNEPPDFSPALYTRLGDPQQFGLSIEVNF
jgi:outer membrane receptor protein involved in Fe transport